MARYTDKTKKPLSPRLRKDGKKARTGKAKREARKRVGRPAAPTAADLGSPQKAEQWLFNFGRSELAAGHTLRASPQDNAEGFAAIEAICHQYAIPLKELGFQPMLVSGAALNAKALLALLEADPPSESATPLSTVVAAAMACAGLRRGAITRLLPGPRYEDIRRKFGIHIPMTANSPASVLTACKNLRKGRRTEAASPAAKLITDAADKVLAKHIKALTAEIGKTVTQRKAVTSQTTQRDIRSAAPELFYDQYAANISVALEEDELARIAALNLVPRRTDRRTHKKVSGKGGTKPTAPVPPAHLAATA